MLLGVTDGLGHLLTFEMTNVEERRVTDDSGLTSKVWSCACDCPMNFWFRVFPPLTPALQAVGSIVGIFEEFRCILCLQMPPGHYHGVFINWGDNNNEHHLHRDGSGHSELERHPILSSHQ